MTKLISTTIPFSGFYETHHDTQFDDELDRLFQDGNGHDQPWTVALARRFFDSCKWGECHKEYAEEYALVFGEKFKIPSLKFEKLWSPKEYNFLTDVIYVTISVEDFADIFRRTPKNVLNSVCKALFTSRSGFISYYSPDYTDWGHTDTWDHHQYGAVIRAMADYEHGGEFDYWAEFGLCEDFGGNGHIQNWMYEHCKEGNRLDAISAYLAKRWDRVALAA